MADFISKLPVITDSTSTINIISSSTIPVSFSPSSTVQAVFDTTATIPVRFSPSSTIQAYLSPTTSTIPVIFPPSSTVQTSIAPSTGSTVEANIYPSKTLRPIGTTLIQQSHVVVDLAAYSSTNILIYVNTSGTAYIRMLQASASGAYKVALRFNSSTVSVGFGTSANPNVCFIFDPPLQATTTNSTIALEVTNREGQAQNIYALYLGWAG